MLTRVAEDREVGKQKAELTVRDVAEGFIAALIVALVLKVFVVDVVRIPSRSMEPTLVPGDIVVVSKLAYSFGLPQTLPFTAVRLPDILRVSTGEPRRGDIVVFNEPEFAQALRGADSREVFIKRIAGIPGDVVDVDGRRVRVPRRGDVIPLTIADIHYWRPLLVNEGCGIECLGSTVYVDGAEQKEYTMREDHLYVLGDNSLNSSDSRYWGLVPASMVLGKAVAVYWSSAEGLPRWERFFRLLH